MSALGAIITPRAKGLVVNRAYRGSSDMEAYDARRLDVAHAAAMEEGSTKLLAAIKRERLGGNIGAPNYLLWLSPSQNNPDSMMQQRYATTQGQRFVDRRAGATYVHRDPCTYCGTRKDIGCKHTRGGM